MKAVEVSIVYEDGTVVRLEGLDAANLGKAIGGALVSGDFTFVAGTVGIGIPYKPFRRVTKVEGRLVHSFDAPPHIVFPRDSEGLIKSTGFADLPRDVVFSDWGTGDEGDYVGPLYRIRSVVEAMPVEKKL